MSTDTATTVPARIERAGLVLFGVSVAGMAALNERAHPVAEHGDDESMSLVARGSPWRELATLSPTKYSPPVASIASATSSATSSTSSTMRGPYLASSGTVPKSRFAASRP
jgi:hypothetical protein